MLLVSNFVSMLTPSPEILLSEMLQLPHQHRAKPGGSSGEVRGCLISENTPQVLLAIACALFPAPDLYSLLEPCDLQYFLHSLRNASQKMRLSLFGISHMRKFLRAPTVCQFTRPLLLVRPTHDAVGREDVHALKIKAAQAGYCLSLCGFQHGVSSSFTACALYVHE